MRNKCRGKHRMDGSIIIDSYAMSLAYRQVDQRIRPLTSVLVYLDSVEWLLRISAGHVLIDHVNQLFRFGRKQR